jgi:hypothetical protein
MIKIVKIKRLTFQTEIFIKKIITCYYKQQHEEKKHKKHKKHKKKRTRYEAMQEESEGIISSDVLSESLESGSNVLVDDDEKDEDKQQQVCLEG